MGGSLNNDGKTAPALFQTGGPGGPGRPKGARSKVARMLDDLAAEDAKDIGRTLIDLAKNGDIAAIRLVAERIWPVSKGRPVEMELPPMVKPDDLVQGVAAIVAAVASGDLSTEEAKDLASVLETHRRAIDTTELERRVTDLERAAKR
jgi:hypothetical protein